MAVVSRASTTISDYGPQLLRDFWGSTAVAILIVILRIIAKSRIENMGRMACSWILHWLADLSFFLFSYRLAFHSESDI